MNDKLTAADQHGAMLIPKPNLKKTQSFSVQQAICCILKFFGASTTQLKNKKRTNFTEM